MSYFVFVVTTAPMKKLQIVEIIIQESGLVAFWLFRLFKVRLSVALISTNAIKVM